MRWLLGLTVLICRILLEQEARAGVKVAKSLEENFEMGEGRGIEAIIAREKRVKERESREEGNVFQRGVFTR